MWSLGTWTLKETLLGRTSRVSLRVPNTTLSWNIQVVVKIRVRFWVPQNSRCRIILGAHNFDNHPYSRPPNTFQLFRPLKWFRSFKPDGISCGKLELWRVWGEIMRVLVLGLTVHLKPATLARHASPSSCNDLYWKDSTPTCAASRGELHV